MPQIPLPVRTSRRHSKRGSALINCYAEPSGPGGEQITRIVGTAGIKDFGDTLPQPGGCRGALVFRDVIYAVVGSYFIAVTKSGTVEKITGPSGVPARINGQTRVTMAVVGDEIAVCDGSVLHV